MVRLDIQFIRGTRPSESVHFDNARNARSHLLQVMKSESSRIEGDGKSGKLVAGKGSKKRIVAVYSMRLQS